LRGQYASIRERGVEVVAVAPTGLHESEGFTASRPLPFPVLADPSLGVFRAYGVESRPLSLGQRPALYAIDRQGIVRYAFLGLQQWQLGNLDEALATMSPPGGRQVLYGAERRGDEA
jgi:peroxiredoxin